MVLQLQLQASCVFSFGLFSPVRFYVQFSCQYLKVGDFQTISKSFLYNLFGRQDVDIQSKISFICQRLAKTSLQSSNVQQQV